jgi:hypothetical protein
MGGAALGMNVTDLPSGLRLSAKKADTNRTACLKTALKARFGEALSLGCRLGVKNPRAPEICCLPASDFCDNDLADGCKAVVLTPDFPE